MGLSTLNSVAELKLNTRHHWMKRCKAELEGREKGNTYSMSLSPRRSDKSEQTWAIMAANHTCMPTQPCDILDAAHVVGA